MQGSPLKKDTNIKRIRTFKDDMALARLQDTSTQSDTEVQQAFTVPATQSKQVAQTQTPKPPVTEEKNTIVTEITPKQNPPIALKAEDITGAAIPYRASILTDNEIEIDSNTLVEGNIVTDTKRKRFNLFKAAAEAFKLTVDEKVDAYKERQVGPTVTKVEERMEVLKKAAENSTRAPREDFSTLAQIVKETKREPVNTSINIVEKSAIPVPTWTYTEESKTASPVPEAVAQNPIQQPEIQPTQAPRITEVVSQQEPVVPRVVQKEIVKESIAPETQQNVVREVPIQKEIPVVVQKAKPEVVTQKAFVTEKVYARTAPTDTLTTKEATPAFIRPLPNTIPDQRQYTNTPTQKVTRSWLPSLTLAGVIFFATVAGVGVSYYVFSLQEQKQEVAVYEVPSQIRAQQSNAFTLPQNRKDTFTAIKTTYTSTTGVVQTYPTVPTKEDAERPATTAEVLAVLDFSQQDSFKRSITEIGFGGIDGTVPFVIIRGTSFEALFAGMLDWEKTMASDLSGLFTTAQLKEPFTDAIVNNRSIRVMQDGSGDDALVYTFVNQNTLILTQDRMLLQKLLPLIK